MAIKTSMSSTGAGASHLNLSVLATLLDAIKAVHSSPGAIGKRRSVVRLSPRQ